MKRSKVVTALVVAILSSVLPASAKQVESAVELAPVIDPVMFSLCGGLDAIGGEDAAMRLAQNDEYREVLVNPSEHCPRNDIRVVSLAECADGSEGSSSHTMMIDINIDCRALLSEHMASYEPPRAVVAVSARTPYPTPPPQPISSSVETWRPLVTKYFRPLDVDHVLRIIGCESLGNPSAQNAFSGASGLMQHMPQYWAERSSAAGYPGGNIWDPETNIAVGAWLLYDAPGGGWHHWVCHRKVG